MLNIFFKNNCFLAFEPAAVLCFFYNIRFVLLVSLMVVSFQVVGQSGVKTETIALRMEKMPFTPKEFYITKVIDERDRRQSIGYILPFKVSQDKSAAAHSLDLKGGGFTAIHQFIHEGLTRNTKLRPVIIRLKECSITETLGAKGRVEGQVVISMVFDLQRDGESIHLVEYIGGGARYNRPAGQLVAVEQALRQSIVSALRFFNNWVNTEVNTNAKFASGIKVFFTDYIPDNVVKEDTVFYATNRPLIWNDFRERPRLERFAASIFPSFAYEGSSEIKNGILHITLQMKVYMLSNASWVKDNARDDYGLNHEQRHFDIVKLIAERFKQKIQPDSLSVEDFDSIIQYQYIESFREMNRLQEQYDKETSHGLDKVAQERWNQRIDEELHSFSVKQ